MISNTYHPTHAYPAETTSGKQRLAAAARLGARAVAGAVKFAGRAARETARFSWRHRVGLSAGTAVISGVAMVGAALVAGADAHYYDAVRTLMNGYMGMSEVSRTVKPSADPMLTLGAVSGAAFAASGVTHLGAAHGKKRAALYALEPGESPLPFSTPRLDGYYLLTAPDFAARIERANRSRRLHEIEAESREAELLDQLGAEMIDTWGGTPAPTTTTYIASSYSHHRHSKRRHFPVAASLGHGLYDTTGGPLAADVTLDLERAGREIVDGFEALLAGTAEQACVPVA